MFEMAGYSPNCMMMWSYDTGAWLKSKIIAMVWYDRKGTG